MYHYFSVVKATIDLASSVGLSVYLFIMVYQLEEGSGLKRPFGYYAYFATCK